MRIRHRIRHRIPALVGGTAVAIVVGGSSVAGAGTTTEALRQPAPAISITPTQAATPDLGPGDQGAAVVEWQEQLNAWIEQEAPRRGTIAVDGVFGPQTEQATIDVQQNLEGVEADGTVEQGTRDALAADLGGSQAPPDPDEESPDPSAPDDEVPPVEPGEGPLIGEWATGDAVDEWQQQLNAWRQAVGLDIIAEDGVYGPVTESATRIFQDSRNVTVDGIVGPETRTEMQDALSGDVQDPEYTVPIEPGDQLLVYGSTGDDVIDWQEQLNDYRASIGIPPIAVDGIYGAVTEDATRQLQAAFDSLVIDGIVGPNTRAVAAQALRSEAGS